MSDRLPDNFRERVLSLIRRIPYGKVATYGQIAAMAGAPRHARFIGRILQTAGDDSLPWHRAINHRGQISLPRCGPYELQKHLLLAEGVEFDLNDRIDLRRFGWHPQY